MDYLLSIRRNVSRLYHKLGAYVSQCNSTGGGVAGAGAADDNPHMVGTHSTTLVVVVLASLGSLASVCGPGPQTQRHMAIGTAARSQGARDLGCELPATRLILDGARWRVTCGDRERSYTCTASCPDGCDGDACARCALTCVPAPPVAAPEPPPAAGTAGGAAGTPRG